MPEIQIDGDLGRGLCQTGDAGQSESGQAEALAARLLALLLDILAGRNDGTPSGGERITTDANWAELGINSVDFLSFVLTVEKEFAVEVPDEDLSAGNLISLAAWARYLEGRLADQLRNAADRG